MLTVCGHSISRVFTHPKLTVCGHSVSRMCEHLLSRMCEYFACVMCVRLVSHALVLQVCQGVSSCVMCVKCQNPNLRFMSKDKQLTMTR